MRLLRSYSAAITALPAAILIGCAPKPSAPLPPVAAALPASVSAAATPAPHGKPLFEDVAPQAGLRFVHTSGATGKFYSIENTPPGCAFIDYDNDGFLDIFLVQSGSSEPPETVKGRPHCALYHSNGDGTFTDVTAGSGLDVDLGYMQGVAVADYDNDGFPDLFVSGYGGNHLFHNAHGTGKFTETTHTMGLDNIQGYATSAAFGDYDNDGKLDLYVCYYIPWTWKTNLPCKFAEELDYCSPEVYEPVTHHLYHNEGNRFVDVSANAGITKARGRGLSVAFIDYDGDGKQDIFVANDLTPNMLWHNNGDGTFTNTAVKAGCAYDEAGSVMAGMGVGIADYDHSGHESLFVGNFSGLPNMLFRNMGGAFREQSYASGLAMPHMKFLTFGCEFMDYDADGWPDLFVVNGHVQVFADKQVEGVTYKERKQLFHNTGKGTFTEVTDPGMLGDLSLPTIGRGMAVGDFDNDGRLDVLVSNQNGPVQLFRNLDQNPNHWVSFKTIGVQSNRDGLHTRFTVIADGMKQTATVRAGSSFLSHSDTRVYFGLGPAAILDRVELSWPSGRKELLSSVKADRTYVVTEGHGITATIPPAQKR